MHWVAAGSWLGAERSGALACKLAQLVAARSWLGAQRGLALALKLAQVVAARSSVGAQRIVALTFLNASRYVIVICSLQWLTVFFRAGWARDLPPGTMTAFRYTRWLPAWLSVFAFELEECEPGELGVGGLLSWHCVWEFEFEYEFERVSE